MDIVSTFVLCLGIILTFKYYSIAQSEQLAVVGSTVQLLCPYDGRNANFISWNKFKDGKLSQLSFENGVTASNFPDLKPRLSVTGDHSAGEYHLNISMLRKSDEGEYRCEDKKNARILDLTVIVGPTDVNIANKISGRVSGTEDQDLTISCTAIGGDPAPDIILQIGTDVYTRETQHTLQHIIQRVSRSYDGVTVRCQTGYEGIPYTSLADTASILLELKPYLPSFNLNPVVTENTKSLVLTCGSAGSRPAPTERIWLIGVTNVDITSSSTSVSSSQQSDGTYTASSTLRYKVNKIYNEQNVTCGFRNTVSLPSFIKNSIRMNVQYAPDVSVPNKTYHLTQTSRDIQCVVDGNPVSTFSRWQHKSKLGKLIRELDGGSTLILPQQAEGIRYQDTGEYVCSVSNGIRDEEGNLSHKGSGFIVSQAPPRFLNGSSQVKLGQYGRNVNIDVSVYSEPKYNTQTWLKDGRSLSQSTKYAMSDVSEIITDTFYDNKVQVDGFTLGLTIKNLVEGDFVNYTLRLSNGVGGSVEHLVVLLSASPPETPANFTVTCSTDSTVALHWIPAFDGGHDQNFYVEYRKIVSNISKTVAVPKESISLLVEFQSFELSGLEENTFYEIRMYAKNRFNKSLPTLTEQISTKVKHRDVECYTVPVAVGLSLLTVISIIVNGVLSYVIWTGKQKSKHTAQYHDRTDTQTKPEVYYNIADNQDDNTDLETSNYETLGTKDKPNLYDDIGRTDRDTKSKLYSNTMI